jgi:hypothetical protein
MTARLVPLLLRLYPQAWRARYGAEYAALLEEHGIDARTLVDVVVGAVDARRGAGARRPVDAAQRRALVASLWAVVLFGAAGAAFQRMAEYDDFTSAAARHPLVGAGMDLIVAGACVVGLAVAGCGLALARSLVDDAVRSRRPDVVRPLAMAMAGVITVALALGALVIYAHTSSAGAPQGAANLAALAAWMLASAVGVGIAIAGAGRALSRATIGAVALRRAVWCAWAGAAGMTVTLAGILVWGIALRVDATGVFGLRHGGDLATPAPYTWAAGAIAMAVALALTLRPLRATAARPGAGPAPPPIRPR